MCDRGYDVLFDAPGRTFTPLGDSTRGTSNYYPPPAIVKLAKDTTGRGRYEFTKRWPGPVVPGRGKGSESDEDVLWRTLEPEHSVLRYGFATPSYVIGSAMLDPSWLDDASMGHRWQGVVFESDLLARIGFEVKPTDENDWHDFNPFFSVQDRNILITQKWAPVPPNSRSAMPARLQVYFSPTLDDVQEKNGWIFSKAGGAFAAVRVVAGGYDWTTPWKHANDVTRKKAFVTLRQEDAPVILLINEAGDYGGDFEAFQAAIIAQPIHSADGTVRFATLTFYGPTRVGEVQGQPVNLAPPRGYDSPFIRSEWNSGLIYIRKGSDTLTLDFRDPQDPKKTIGAR